MHNQYHWCVHNFLGSKEWIFSREPFKSSYIYGVKKEGYSMKYGPLGTTTIFSQKYMISRRWGNVICTFENQHRILASTGCNLVSILNSWSCGRESKSLGH